MDSLTIIALLVSATFASHGDAAPPSVACCRDLPVTIEGDSILELTDESGTLTLAEVRALLGGPRWQLVGGEVPSMGYTDAAHWFVFSLANHDPQRRSVVIELAWPVMEEIDVYVVRGGGGTAELVSTFQGGSSRLFSLKKFAHHHLIVPTDLETRDSVQVFTRLSTRLPMQLPIQVHDAASFYEASTSLSALSGVYYGLMLMIAFYNLVLFFSLRESSHLYLGLFVFFEAGLQASFSGLVHRFLFPFSPTLNVLSIPLCLNATLLLGILFTISFLELRETAPLPYRFFRAMTVLAAIGMIVAPLSLRLSAALGNLFAIPICVGALATGLSLALRGHRSARLYTLAWALLLLGATALALNKLGIVPYNVLTEYGWSLGGVIMAALLSLGLAQSTQKLRRDQARVHALVDERTEELHNQTQLAIAARTEADQLRREAEHSAKKLEDLDKQKTAFFQNVSHELRTPLTLILNPLDKETRDQPDNRNLEMAAKNARRLLRLVNQLLDFQKLEAGKKELILRPINLVRFVQISGSYFGSACSSKDISFRLTLNGTVIQPDAVPQEVVCVSGESDALEKIVFNYLSNALKHTPPGGDIELGLTVIGERVRIFVKDSGRGITEEDQRDLFQIFSQVGNAASREQLGTGLGLTLVKELTELMGGEVGVTSKIGTGSTFWSDFPLELAADADELATVSGDFEVRDWLLDGGHEPTGQQDVVTESLVEEGSGHLVLVVDDLADMRSLIGNTLKNRNYRILAARDGKAGLELAQEHMPDLIITDWMMPKMDGPQLIRELKASPELSSIPVILLTARSDEESKLLGTEMGADAFVGKPFNEIELVSIVRNLLQLKAREREVTGLNRQLVENVLKRYLPPDLVNEILAGQRSLEEAPKSVSAVILFSDLTGFTSLSSTIRAAKIARVLNEYLSSMTDVIFSHGGTIDKFIGDAIMVIFGAPMPLTPTEQATRATQCAASMQEAMVGLNEKWIQEGIPEFKMRIGIHNGPVVVGNFGSKRRSEYTAIGPTVNLASRIESACEPGQIFISGELYDYLPEDAAALAGEFELKGLDGKHNLYRLVH